MAIEELIISDPPHRSFGRWVRLFVTLSFIVALGCLLFLRHLNLPPSAQETPTVVTIERGTTVKEITTQLERANVVTSAQLLYFVLTLFYNPEEIKASTYVFEQPLTTFAVAERLMAGDFDSDLIRFTHFEGERVTHIADRAASVLPNFDKTLFIEQATPLEGKLYPETYFIPKEFTAPDMIALMLQGYEKNIQPLIEASTNSALSQEEVLVLASILEREANSVESMRMVSGILQKRLQEGMPLQADASIEYVLDKPLKELTPDDLKIDSPYNTYTNRGLPPTPIGNPGKDAVLAALDPIKTDYLFYITGNDGEFYYAETYAEHNQNIDRYLR